MKSNIHNFKIENSKILKFNNHHGPIYSAAIHRR